MISTYFRFKYTMYLLKKHNYISKSLSMILQEKIWNEIPLELLFSLLFSTSITTKFLKFKYHFKCYKICYAIMKKTISAFISVKIERQVICSEYDLFQFFL